MVDDRKIHFVVDPDDEGERLDKVVLRRAGGIGRRSMARLFRSGAVRVDGRRCRPGATAEAGQHVQVELPSQTMVPDENAPLSVLLERPDLVAVDKPAGIPTVPVRPGETETLASRLLGRYPEMATIGHRAREPGVIHRLDTGTSGVVIAARTEQAFVHLSKALTLGGFDKRYLALVPSAGLPGSGEIDEPLAPTGPGRRRVGAARDGSRDARPALTRWNKRRVRGPWALVEVHVTSAYRHQVRAHLAHIGHPIAGDRLYGGSPIEQLGRGRHALHAHHVAWAGDDAVPGFRVEAPLPVDLAGLLDDG